MTHAQTVYQALLFPPPREARASPYAGKNTVCACAKIPWNSGASDTIRTFSDIFVIINGRGMYSASASVRVTVKLAFLVLPVLSCLSRVSFLGFEG